MGQIKQTAFKFIFYVSTPVIDQNNVVGRPLKWFSLRKTDLAPSIKYYQEIDYSRDW